MVVRAYAYAYTHMNHDSMRSNIATTIACLHHYLLAYRGETSNIVREQVSVTEFHGDRKRKVARIQSSQLVCKT